MSSGWVRARPRTSPCVALGERVKAGLKIVGIPTSNATAELAKKVGVPLTTLDEHPVIDITIDGADEIDPHLNLIKGGGGALLREKVVASASKKMVVISDSSKLVPVLGKFPLPVEVISFARAVVEKKIAGLGASVKWRTRADGSAYLTDNGNPILDCSFGKIEDPAALARIERHAGRGGAWAVHWAGKRGAGGQRWGCRRSSTKELTQLAKSIPSRRVIIVDVRTLK